MIHLEPTNLTIRLYHDPDAVPFESHYDAVCQLIKVEEQGYIVGYHGEMTAQFHRELNEALRELGIKNLKYRNIRGQDREIT